MHFYMRLILQYPFAFLFVNDGVPPGFARLITIRGNFVVTSRGRVIAKDYT